MMPITPSGTRIWPTWIPLGRNFRLEISPIGSDRETICSNPSAMVAIALSDKLSRSSIASDRPLLRAAVRSCSLAARSSAASRRIAPAIVSSA